MAPFFYFIDSFPTFLLFVISEYGVLLPFSSLPVLSAISCSSHAPKSLMAEEVTKHGNVKVTPNDVIPARAGIQKILI